MSERLRGRYELGRKLGEGTQGETYEAFDHGAAASPNLDTQWKDYVDRKKGRPLRAGEGAVAIKCFRVGTAKAWKDVELAEREARTLASLSHPRLPRYIEHFEENGVLYLVMEKIEGEDLARLRKAGRSFGPEEVMRMLEDVASALTYLHGRAPSIVHRDVKPGNVIRRPDGSFALVDLGAVRDRLKAGGGSTVVGTFGFMAPEQFQGRASARSDVYGLGATALAMLTGEEPEDLPHEGLGIDVARALPPGTPAPLARALTAMLVPDPDRRVASMADALSLLRASIPAPRPEPPPAAKRKPSKKERRRIEREVRRQRRPRVPTLPRLVARLGLFVASVVVGVAVGLVVPLVLVVLSLLFGGTLRRAASATAQAATRARAALRRASAWLSGADRDEAVRIRVADEVRWVTPEQAQRIAIDQAEARGEDADAWLEEQLEKDEKQRQREQMRRHARPRNGGKRGKHWGR